MSLMRRKLLRWHVWLGWLIGVPLVLWTVTGVVMVARPIEEVRGSDLQIERPSEVLPRGLTAATPFLAPDGKAVREFSVTMRDGVPLTLVTYLDDSQAMFHAVDGRRLGPVDRAMAESIVRENIVTATVPATIPPKSTIVGATLFPSDAPPVDFRQPKPVWQVRLADGTHVYVGRDSGRIEAVRTQFWRVFDLMWGLHIMDLQTREDTHHPILVLFASLAAIGSLLGCVLMIVRHTRPKPAR